MIVKNGKKRFHHCRILLQFGEIYSSKVHRKNQWNPTMKDNFIIHNPYKKMTTILWNRFSCFKATQASQYYTERARLTARRKYIKPSLTDGVVQQIICTIKIRRAPTRHDIIYQPIITDIRNLNIVGEDRRQGILWRGQSHTSKRRTVCVGAYRQVVCMNQYEGSVGDTQNK